MSDTDRYPNNVEIRTWAQSKSAGASVSSTGALPRFVILAWNKAHPDRPYVAGQAYHGTLGGYNNHHCRCERCTEAAVERNRNYLAAGGGDRWDFNDAPTPSVVPAE